MPSEKITNIIKTIGQKIKPSHTMVLVAGAELFFRPLFTMMDKKTPAETKKYTALREGITEIVAVSAYLSAGKFAPKIAKAICKDPAKIAKATHNIELVGVWTAAVMVIPSLCSLVVTPFTKKLFNKKNENDKGLNIVSKPDNQKPFNAQIPSTGNITNFRKTVNMAAYTNSGMKVG